MCADHAGIVKARGTIRNELENGEIVNGEISRENLEKYLVLVYSMVHIFIHFQIYV